MYPFVLVFLLIWLVSCEKMPGMKYLAAGYDYYMGNPLTTTRIVDSGFRSNAVFKLTYEQGKTTDDGKWDVPDGVTTIPDNSCSLEFATTEISGMTKYTELLNFHVGYFPENWKGRFKASYDYKDINAHT